MRVLVTTTGFPGHVLPLVPFARACMRAGHELCVAGPRSAEPLVRGVGLPFCGCADLPHEALGRIVAEAAELPPDDGHAHMIAEGFGRTATRAVLADALQLVGAWRPDVILRESQSFAGYLAAEHHRIPHARAALGLAATEQETVSLAAAPMRELRAEIGLPRDDDGARMARSPLLTLVPGALDDAASDGAQRFRQPPAAARPLPEWWGDNDDPLVYVTFGSVADQLGYFPDLHRAACAALADLPVRVLLTIGDRDPGDLGPLPDNVHAERWVEQDHVLPHAAAVVCHGGYGSVLGALAAARPLVVLPLFAGDQRGNARRVAEIGAGIALEEPRRTMFEQPGPGVLAALPDAVRAVLDTPAYGDAARRVAEDVAALPPVHRAVDALRAVARDHDRRTP